MTNQNNQNSGQKKKIFTKSFYSSKTGLQIMLSEKGVFCNLALATDQMKNGKPTFNWKEKVSTKLSTGELGYILEGMQRFRIYGEKGYRNLASFLNNNSDKYKDIEFIHKRQGDGATIVTIVGLQVYNGRLNFHIKPGTSKNVAYYIQKTDWIDIENWIGFILSKRYETDFFLSDGNSRNQNQDPKPQGTYTKPANNTSSKAQKRQNDLIKFKQKLNGIRHIDDFNMYINNLSPFFFDDKEFFAAIQRRESELENNF